MRCIHVTDEEEDDAKPSVVTSKHVSVQLTVPRHAVGAVIGQQGAQIKQVVTMACKTYRNKYCPK